ncbi:MAG: hypothetical protein LIO58_02475 [Oscillospiraceae bacterium]|nr:hypothetical protein [Oscillospiraceae bacterium]
MRLRADDVFRVARNAQKAGLFALLPSVDGLATPGERFFESMQSRLLENVNLEQLDTVLNHLAPVIHYMADETHWEPVEFTGEDMFRAVRNLQRMGAFEIINTRLEPPGSGDRFFEHYQTILVEKLGVKTLDELLYTLGQCIKFLATDAAMVNVKSCIKRSPCA